MTTAIYPGSFDPITLGHENIIKRAANLVDILYVAPLGNYNKKNSLFSIDERINLINKVCKDIKNVKTITFDGLLKDCVKSNNITFIIKGVRNNIDFDSEFQMATAISMLDSSVETLFLPTDVSLLPISSSMVRDLASCKGDLSKFVSSSIIKDIEEKYSYL